MEVNYNSLSTHNQMYPHLLCTLTVYTYYVHLLDVNPVLPVKSFLFTENEKEQT